MEKSPEATPDHELQALAFENLPSLACVFSNEQQIVPNRMLRQFIKDDLPPGTTIDLGTLVSKNNLKDIQQKINSITPSLPQTEIEFIVKNQQTNYRPVKMGWTISGLFNPQGQIESIIGIGKDITEVKKKEEKLRSDAYIDTLTGLFNRNFFEAQKQIFNQKRKNENIGLIVFDLDNLKSANDQFGHLAGDQLLLGISSILKETFRGEDIICRIGGDEFAVVCQLEEGLSAQELDSQMAVILERLSNNTINHNTVRLSEKHQPEVAFSFGYSFLRSERNPFDAALKRADLAMYRQKNYHKYPQVITIEEYNRRLKDATSSGN